MGYLIVRMKGRTINHSNKETKVERKTEKKYITISGKIYDVTSNVDNHHKSLCI